MNKRIVSVYFDEELYYPDEPPFSPDTDFPEYKLKSLSKNNKVYSAIRNLFLQMGLDKENFGSKHWNPLKNIVKKGDVVVIKPNFVIHQHEKGGNIYSIITHPSLIRAVIDYVYIALDGNGRIIVADAPSMDCNFEKLLEITNLRSISEIYKKEKNFDIEIMDLRNMCVDILLSDGNIPYREVRRKLKGDPEGEIKIDLGKDSLFYKVKNYRNFYGADIDRSETIKYHNKGSHIYLISKTILNANVLISIPKMKVHKKVGVTLNIKGLVGTVTNKNCLIHFTIGAPPVGDQFPEGLLNRKEKIKIFISNKLKEFFLTKQNKIFEDFYKTTKKIWKKFSRNLKLKERNFISTFDYGNWYGNDSCWRMACDLYRIFKFSDRNGNYPVNTDRKFFSVVDGVISGEENGPLAPKEKITKVLVAGDDFPSVDIVCARLMGFDIKKIKMLKWILENPELFDLTLDKIEVVNNMGLENIFSESNRNSYFNFEPHQGWKGYIEI